MVRAFSFCPSLHSQLIACSKKGNVYIWKYSSTAIQPRLKFHAHDEYVLSCKVSMTNKWDSLDSSKYRMLATTSADRSIKLWDLDTMEVTKLIGHEVCDGLIAKV